MRKLMGGLMHALKILSKPILLLALFAVLGTNPAAAETPSDKSGAETASSAVPIVAQPKAEEKHRIVWDPAWSKVSTTEYVALAAGAAGDAALAIWMPAPKTPGWTATNGFDDAFRGALRLPTQGGRDAMNTTSTVLVGALAAFPVVVDAVGVVMIGDKNPKVGMQMILIDAESFATILGGLFLTKNSVARERPYNRSCPNSNCDATDRFESFFSGHTSLAFNSAGLICAEHLNMHLYGSKVADALVCASALATATAVGAMRIMADQHYATDVLAGAALGSLTGFLIPQLHFGFGHSGTYDSEGRETKAVNIAVAPVVNQVQQGLSATIVW